MLHKFQTFLPLRNLKTRTDPSSESCCLPKTHLRLWDPSSRLDHPSHFPQNLGVARGRERTRQTPPLLSLGKHTAPEVAGNRHTDGEPSWPWLTFVPSFSFPVSRPLPCFSSHPTPRHSTAKLSLCTQTSPSRPSHSPGDFPRGAGRAGGAGQGHTVVPGAPRSPRMVRRRAHSLPPPAAARPARPAASAPSAPRPRRPSGSAPTPRPPSRRGNCRAARPPPPSPAPQSRGSAPRGAEAGREGLPGRASRTRLRAVRFLGLRSGRGAVELDSLPRRPRAPRGSADPASSAPVLQVCLLSHRTGAGRGPFAGVARPGAHLRLAPIHPAKVKRREKGRPRFARNVRRSGTQTMTPLPAAPGPPPAPPARGGHRPRGCPCLTPLLPGAGDARRPGAVPASCPTVPAGGRGRLRPHLSKFAGGRAAGTTRPTAPSLHCAPPPGRVRRGVGAQAGCTLFGSPNSPKPAWRALTQKRGLSRGSARVLAQRVALQGSLPPQDPAGPLGRRLPELPGPCVGYLGCRSKVVQVKGKRCRGPGPEGGGRGGAGWGGVEAPRTQPGGPGGEARAGQWVLPSTSASGEGLVSHRGFQPSHSEPAS